MKLNYSDRYSLIRYDSNDSSCLTYTRVSPSGHVQFVKGNSGEHRDRGPAWISPEGKLSYCIHGKVHRADGPALITEEVKSYCIMGAFLSPEEFFLKYGVV